MAVTAFAYGLGVKYIMDGSLVPATDTLKCALITSAYTPNQDTDQFFSTPAANEVSGTNYTAGGVTLGSKTSAYDSATNEERLDAADPAWTGAAITARYAVYYKSTGSNSTSPLLVCVNFGADQAVNPGNFSLIVDVTGWLKGVAV
jgi:hypothetical protein